MHGKLENSWNAESKGDKNYECDILVKNACPLAVCSSPCADN